MRPILLLTLALLAGCQTMREAAGSYSRFAEKGIVLKGGEDSAQAGNPMVATQPAAPAEARPQALPGGLVGDGQAHSYSEPAPRSS